MKIIKKSTEKLLIESFIKEFLNKTSKKEKKGKKVSFVLTGGPSPINLYKKISGSAIKWDNIDLFWGDERFVSKSAKSSNFNLVQKNLLRFIKIKKKQIFEINTNKSSVEIASDEYSKKIEKYFKKEKVSFDIILLGMGDDGHIASIFPENLKNKSKNLCSHIIRNDFKRITLNLKTINSSKFIFLWLNSKKKYEIYKNLKNKKKLKIPVSFLDKKKMTVFSII